MVTCIDLLLLSFSIDESYHKKSRQCTLRNEYASARMHKCLRETCRRRVFTRTCAVREE